MVETLTTKLQITSPAFDNEGPIPMKYTCDGEAVNPPLSVKNIPHGTQSLALVVEDPDAPGGTYDHWIVWNISPSSPIAENSNPGISGSNSSDKTGYHPPCPPEGSHRYYFHVYALDSELKLAPGAKKSQLMKAMKNHLLGKGFVMAQYERESSDYER